MKELNEEFTLNNVTITASFSGSKEILFDALDYHAVANYFEFMQFTMSTDMDLFSSNVVNRYHVSDLDYTIESILKSDMPLEKVVIGILQFGGAEVDVLKVAYVSRPCEEIKNSASLHCPCKNSVLGNRIKNGLIEFETARSVANKVRMIVKRNLLGIMTTVIYMDDLLGRHQLEPDTFMDYKPIEGITLNIPQRLNVHFPLLKTINSAISVTLDEMKQEKKLQQQLQME